MSSQDAGSDATVGADAAPVDDAASDVVGVDAATADGAFQFTDPCTTPHTLCCNFDDGGVTTCWTTTQGSVDLADATAVSPPYSMHAAAVGDASYSYGRASLGGGQSMTCTFDLYIEKLTGSTHVLGQIVVNGDDTHGFQIVTQPIVPDSGLPLARAQLFGRGPAGTQIFLPQTVDLPLHTWIRIQMSSVFTGASGTGKFSVLSFDAGPPIDFPTDDVANIAFGFRAGILFNATGSAGVYVDNIACDTHL